MTRPYKKFKLFIRLILFHSESFIHFSPRAFEESRWDFFLLCLSPFSVHFRFGICEGTVDGHVRVSILF